MKKVICINKKPIFNGNPYNPSLEVLTEGEIYTVIRLYDNGNAYLLEEVKSSHPRGGFNSSRFIPCSEIDETELVNQKLQTV